MSCSPATLLSDGKDFQSLSEYAQLVVIAELLCEISGSASGATLASALTGSGSPEGVVTAGPGSFYNQIDSGVFVRTWIKQTGTGSTGWI